MTEKNRRIGGKPAAEWLLHLAKEFGCSGAATSACIHCVPKKGTTRFRPWLFHLLADPGDAWGAALFRQLTCPRVIRYLFKRIWGSAQIDEELWHSDIGMAAFPGARFAPLYFLSDGLFSADIHTITWS
jgi:hypothetical protein